MKNETGVNWKTLCRTLADPKALKFIKNLSTIKKEDLSNIIKNGYTDNEEKERNFTTY